MYFECDMCNVDRVWHVEDMADFGCEVGVGPSRTVVHVWIPDSTRRRLGWPLRFSFRDRFGRTGYEEFFRVYCSTTSRRFLFDR